MTPLQILSKLNGNKKLTEEESERFIRAFIRSIHYEEGRYRRDIKKPKYSVANYTKIFAMLGVCKYSWATGSIIKTVCDLFPDEVIANLENDTEKIYSLATFFDSCIMYLLLPGGTDHYRAYSDSKIGKDDNKQYGYVPSSIYSLAKLYVHKDPFLTKGKKFIDVGCGIGDKTIFVHMLKLPIRSYGIEYDYINANFGKKAVERLPYNRRSKPDIWTGDAFETDFADFDRIYTYAPLHDNDRLKEFYKHIWETVNVGTEWLEILACSTLANCGASCKVVPAVRKKKVSSHIYTKTKY